MTCARGRSASCFPSLLVIKRLMPGSAANIMPGDPGPRSIQEGPTPDYQRAPAADYLEKKGPRTPEEPLQASAPRNPRCRCRRRRRLRCLQRLKSNKKTTVAVGILLLFVLVTPLNVYVWLPFFRQGHHEISCPFRPRCPDYSVHFKEKCYYLNETREDWHASNHSCSLNNGSLAVFKTPKDLIPVS
ncbi:uncharacterized protein LOC144767856 [Lissotriton helveticus]